MKTHSAFFTLSTLVCFWCSVSFASGPQSDAKVVELTNNLKLHPGNALYYNKRGMAYLRLGDYDRAIADFDQASRLWPQKSSALHNNRALALTGKGQHDRAIADYNRALQIEPKNAWTFLNRAKAYHAKGDHRRAVKDYDEAIALSPRYVDAYYNRALAYLRTGDRKRALDDLDTAERLQPNLRSTPGFTKARQEATASTIPSDSPTAH